MNRKNVPEREGVSGTFSGFKWLFTLCFRCSTAIRYDLMIPLFDIDVYSVSSSTVQLFIEDRVADEAAD